MGNQTAPSFDFDGLTVSGSADLSTLNLNGLGVVGGAADWVVDTFEYLEFVFDAPADNISYFIQSSGCSGTGCIVGARTIEAFGAGGVSLGTISQISSGTFSLTTLFGSALIESFRITATPPAGTTSAFTFSTINFDLVSAPEVPLPAALPLFLAGLAGLGLRSRKKAA